MVEEDYYCTDILIQVSAITAALNSFNKILLSNHIHTCVAEDIRNGKDETIDELVAITSKNDAVSFEVSGRRSGYETV